MPLAGMTVNYSTANTLIIWKDLQTAELLVAGKQLGDQFVGDATVGRVTD